MKFKDLLSKFNDQEILARLFVLYPDQKKSIKGYTKALAELRTLKSQKPKDGMFILLRDDIDTDDLKVYTSVSGAIAHVEEYYAIEFTDWKIWLGMEIPAATCRWENGEAKGNYPEIDVLCHCLWEMTWKGYTNSEVKKSAKALFSHCAKAMKEIAEREKIV